MPRKEADLAQRVGANLRSLRAERKLSLERLAQKSGVSRSMLGQIELGQSVPTISVGWKIAQALDVPFSALIAATTRIRPTILRADEGTWMQSASGKFRSRALFPAAGPCSVELYELRLAPGGQEGAEPHAPGTLENLVVAQGQLEVTLEGEGHILSAGDALLFEADRPHAYANRGRRETIVYLVMTYRDRA